MKIAPFAPARFDDTVHQYVSARLRYAPALIDKIARRAGLDRSGRVLDLGCGPGFIANAIAPHAELVYGLDPSRKMLGAAETAATDQGLRNVAYLEGSSLDLSRVPGPIDLVTIGRAFHWMDRDETLRKLDDLVAPQGFIALLSDTVLGGPETAWWRKINEIAKSYAVMDDCAQYRYSDAWEPHEYSLLRSTFSEVEALTVFVRHTWSPDKVITHILSRSGTTTELLGAKAPLLETDIRAVLDETLQRQSLSTVNAHIAVMASRPSHT